MAHKSSYPINYLRQGVAPQSPKPTSKNKFKIPSGRRKGWEQYLPGVPKAGATVLSLTLPTRIH